MTAAHSELPIAGDGRLMSGVTLKELQLPDAMDVRPTDGTCGAIVRGVDSEPRAET